MKRQNYIIRDGELSALHFGDTSKPVRLVFLHANGFNARSYRTLLESLNVHAVAFDMRGHGESRHLPQSLKHLSNWTIFAKDCVEFFDRHLPQLTDGPVVLSGHSFGATSAVLAAPDLKGRIGGYVGFDPVTFPRTFSFLSALPGARAYGQKRLPIARNARRRTAVFESPEAAFKRWRGKRAFEGISDEILRDYIAGGLVERSDSQWELACDPKWESAIFVSQAHNIFKAARSLPRSSTFLYAGGKQAVSTGGTRRAIKRAREGVDVQYDPELGHLFPFTHPDRAAQALRHVLTSI